MEKKTINRIGTKIKYLTEKKKRHKIDRKQSNKIKL